jgi:hypothetical protein
VSVNRLLTAKSSTAWKSVEDENADLLKKKSFAPEKEAFYFKAYWNC